MALLQSLGVQLVMSAYIVSTLAPSVTSKKQYVNKLQTLTKKASWSGLQQSCATHKYMMAQWEVVPVCKLHLVGCCILLQLACACPETPVNK